MYHLSDDIGRTEVYGYVPQECSGLLEKMHQFQGYGGPVIFRQLVSRLYVCFRDTDRVSYLWSTAWFSTSLQFLSAAHISPSPWPYYRKFARRILKHGAQLTKQKHAASEMVS